MSHPPVHQDQEVRYFVIRRPVLAAVISIVIVLLGLFALLRLPVSRYPQITPDGLVETPPGLAARLNGLDPGHAGTDRLSEREPLQV